MEGLKATEKGLSNKRKIKEEQSGRQGLPERSIKNLYIAQYQNFYSSEIKNLIHEFNFRQKDQRDESYANLMQSENKLYYFPLF